MIQDQVIQIAKDFLRRRRSIDLPVLRVVFWPASETLYPHLARDCWSVVFDRRILDGDVVRDPCIIRVKVDDATGEPSFALDL
jgi:hypothetical protein